MKAGNVFAIAVLMLAALMATGFAASSSGPTIQVSEQTIVPSSVYPGTTGYLKITLTNNGDTAATGVTAHYTPTLDSSTSGAVYSGDIPAGSSAQMTVPFRVPQESAGGIWLVRVDVYYTYTSGSGDASRSVSISVPIEITQESVLDVATSSAGDDALAPGEKVTLDLDLTNTGGVVNGLVISMPQNSTFSLDGATQKTVGSIPSNTTKRIALTLLASSSTTSGIYNVPVVFTYKDALEKPIEKTLYVGPVKVSESSSQYRVSFEPMNATEIGTPVVFRLTVQNMGTNEVSAVVDINSTSVFTTIGMQRIYFDRIPAGGSASKDVTIGISSSTSSGYYTLPLKLTPSTGQTIVYNTGVVVDPMPEVSISLDSTSGVLVANTGSTQIKSVNVKAWSSDSPNVITESFIGTLNVDDFASMDLTQIGTGAVDVQVTFRDSNNIQHTITKVLDSESGTGLNASISSTANGGQQVAPAGGFNRQAGGNPLSMIFGGGRGTASSGPNWILIGAGVVVVAVGGYLFYTRYWKKRHQANEKIQAKK